MDFSIQGLLTLKPKTTTKTKPTMSTNQRKRVLTYILLAVLAAVPPVAAYMILGGGGKEKHYLLTYGRPQPAPAAESS
jgi:hypothetical protein